MKYLTMAAMTGAALLAALMAPAGAAKMPRQTQACRISAIYMTYINRQDVDALRRLFADGATYIGPDGITLTDPKLIAAKYAHGFANMGTPWRFRTENLLPFDGNGCILEFSKYVPETDSWRLAAVDRIRVNPQGKVIYFIPYVSSLQLQETLNNIHKTSPSPTPAPATQ